MHDDVPIEELEVIGTTTILADLPKRLSPVYRQRGTKGTCYFTVDEDGDAPPSLSSEELEYFDDLVASGDAVRFDRPIPARVGHRLVQLEHGAPPEYFPAADLPTRLFRACREALERASRALSEGRRDEAERLAWYARRASYDDPLPLLLLIALLRGVLPAEELQFLERDLEEYSPPQLEHARRRAHERAELSALGDLIDEQPRSGALPACIASYHSKRSYVPRMRGYTTGAARRGQRASAYQHASV